MDISPRLSLPYLLPNQAQKHVTLNDALRRLDAIVQARILSMEQIAAPDAPSDGDAYVLPDGAYPGAWSAGHAGQLAVYQDGSWAFISPQAGWLVFDLSRSVLVLFDGADWVDLSDRQVPRLGINMIADKTNRLAVKADAELLTHDDITPGSGNARKIINKADEQHAASVLFQTNYVGRAEFGLTGDDDFHIKVSADGTNWTEAMSISRDDGLARFPQGIAHAATGLPVVQYLPSPVQTIWRLDTMRPATPRTYTISSASGMVLTLGSAVTNEIFSDAMRGNVAVRVWNISKSPAEAAWIDWNLSATELQVTDAAHIADWSGGDMLRLGDPNPTGNNVLELVALDISGYLQAQLGAVFPQRGVMLGLYISSMTGPAGLAFSSDGRYGTAFGGNALSNGNPNSVAIPIMTSEQSPISNSNLIFMRESVTGTASDVFVTFARVLGVYV